VRDVVVLSAVKLFNAAQRYSVSTANICCAVFTVRLEKSELLSCLCPEKLYVSKWKAADKHDQETLKKAVSEDKPVFTFKKYGIWRPYFSISETRFFQHPVSEIRVDLSVCSLLFRRRSRKGMLLLCRRCCMGCLG